jgi:8-oxo-dGTP pyrophosphatase MutT (NUDIX family)
MSHHRSCSEGAQADRPGPAADPLAPYVRLAVAGLIRRGDGRAGATETRSTDGATWLLLHRTEPLDAWDPPGGRMEEGEDLAAAVKREVAEETGLTVQVAGPCYAKLVFYKGERVLVVNMACRAIGDLDHVTLEPDGATEWRWVSAREWEDLAATGQTSFRTLDVRRVTRMATVVLETEDE